jgi:hypothetical protein
MKLSTNDNLVLALTKNNEAKKLFEYVRHEVSGDVKHFINRLIARCEANEMDVINRMTCDKNRELFIKEIRKGDTLQFTYIMQQIFEMSQDKRDMVEQIVNSIHKGEKIEMEAAA